MACDKLNMYAINAKASIKIRKWRIIPNNPRKMLKRNLKKYKSEKEEKEEQSTGQKD